MKLTQNGINVYRNFESRNISLEVLRKYRKKILKTQKIEY